MKANKLLFVVMTLGFIHTTQISAQTPEPPADLLEAIEDSYIFVFDPSVPAGQVRGLAKGLANKQGGKLGRVFSHSIKGFSAKMPAKAAEKLASNNPNILYYAPNGLAFAKAEITAGAKGKNPKPSENMEEQLWNIQRVGGFRETTDSTPDLWILDSGIVTDHPDLNIVEAENEVSYGKNTPEDGNTHGTHVAGIAAAKKNGQGIVGVAAGAKIHSIRVLHNSLWGSYDDILAGIERVARDAVAGDVVNMSLYATQHYQPWHDAILATADKGIKFAVCAGNESNYAGDLEPARVEHPNVYTVSAIDENDGMYQFSSYGNPPIDFAAPGVEILSYDNNGGMVSWNGCSMATPHVAGILLFTTPEGDGYVKQDPDGVPDPIAHFPK